MRVRLLGPCFKTGRLRPLCQHPKHVNVSLSSEPEGRAEFLGPNHRIRQESITHPERCHIPRVIFRRSKPMLTRSPGSTPSKKLGWSPANATDIKRFPFSNFTYCLTLFPKFFSSFPHGTCSLSVSRLYLALDGIYHPIWAAFPNNSTRRERITKPWQSVSKTGFSPSTTFHSRKLIHGPARKTLL